MPDRRGTANKQANANDGSQAAPTHADDKSPDQATVIQAIRELRDELIAKIDQKAETQRTELRTQIEALQGEFKKANEIAEARRAVLEGRVASLEEAANEQSDTVTALEQEVSRMKKDISTLKDRAEDLEARSRRCNIRVVGVREGRENGKRPVQFIADMLRELLQLEKTPVLDRAHRALRSKPTQDNQPPRAFIARCHYFQEKEEILRKAATLRQLKTRDGDMVRVLPDFTQAVSRQRAAFTEVRSLLRSCEGIRFGLWYPADLRITLEDGTRMSFRDPDKAKAYVMDKLVTLTE